MFKKLKIFFYQRRMRMFSLEYFEEKKIEEIKKLSEAQNDKAQEEEKTRIASLTAKNRWKIMNRNEWKKTEDVNKYKNEIKKEEYHQTRKICAQQTIKQAEKEIKFWSLMLELKEKMIEINRQRTSHKNFQFTLKKEETKIAKNMAKSFV